MTVKGLKNKLISFPQDYGVVLNEEFIIKVYVDHTNKVVRLYTASVKPPEELVPPERRETVDFIDMVDDDGQLIMF